MFFFSSRRRHTRFDCDWSSDVCSSDLDLRRQPGDGQRLARSRRADEHDDTTPSLLEGEGLERSEEHTSELQSQSNLVCRLLLEKKKKKKYYYVLTTNAINIYCLCTLLH